MQRSLILLLVCSGCAVGAPLAPVIDGRFDDWSQAQATMPDDVGDAVGFFDALRLDAIASNGRIALRLELDDELNLQSGPGSQGTLRIEISASSAPEEAIVIDLRARRVTKKAGPLTWDDIDFVSAPTVASTLFELSIDAPSIGAQVGDTITIDLEGSDDLDEPMTLEMEKGPLVVKAPVDPTKQKGVLRVASVNTLQTGSLHPTRADQLGALIDAMDPDIVCLQEEWKSSAASVGAWLTEHDPLEDGRTWTAHKIGSNVIATPQGTSIIPVDVPGARATMAIVDTTDGAYLIGSVHLKCCGYAGSSEDNQRVGEAEAMRQAVVNLREANLGSSLKAYHDAPFLLVGDWNHVGSNRPLEVFLDDDTLGSVDLAPMRLSGTNNATWRDLTPSSGGFPPGRLDLAIASDSLPVARRFLFSTRDLDDETLDAMGLEHATSEASDHLMLVVDIAE